MGIHNWKKILLTTALSLLPLTDMSSTKYTHTRTKVEKVNKIGKEKRPIIKPIPYFNYAVQVIPVQSTSTTIDISPTLFKPYFQNPFLTTQKKLVQGNSTAHDETWNILLQTAQKGEMKYEAEEQAMKELDSARYYLEHKKIKV